MTGLRERKRDRTRAAITRAAAELILEHGFDGATVAQIAERADVSPRTVFVWFPTKEAIILNGLDEPLEELHEHLRNGVGDTVDRFDAWLSDQAARDPARDSEVERLRQRAMVHDPHLRGVLKGRFEVAEAAVAASVAAETGDDPQDVAIRTFAACATATLMTIQRVYAESDEPRPEARPAALSVLRGARAGLRAYNRTDHEGQTGK